MTELKVTKEQEQSVKGRGYIRNRGTDLFSARIVTVNGKITSEQQRALAEAAEKYGNGEVYFTVRLTIEIPGIRFEDIPKFDAFLDSIGLATGGTGAKVRPVVACKGSVCANSTLDAFPLAEKIHNKFYVGYRDLKLPHKFKIGIAACPSNCTKPSLNDFGILGQLVPNYNHDLCRGCKVCPVQAVCPMDCVKRTEDGTMKITEVCNNCGKCVGKCTFDSIPDGKYAYQLYIGGMWGKHPRAGTPLKQLVYSEEELFDIIEKAILLYKDLGEPGERLGMTVDRVGIDEVERLLFSDELLERKDEILADDKTEDVEISC